MYFSTGMTRADNFLTGDLVVEQELSVDQSEPDIIRIPATSEGDLSSTMGEEISSGIPEIIRKFTFVPLENNGQGCRSIQQVS